MFGNILGSYISALLLLISWYKLKICEVLQTLFALPSLPLQHYHVFVVYLEWKAYVSKFDASFLVGFCRLLPIWPGNDFLVLSFSRWNRVCKYILFCFAYNRHLILPLLLASSFGRALFRVNTTLKLGEKSSRKKIPYFIMKQL